MSTLRVSTLTARTGTGNVAVPTGNRIVATDSGAIQVPDGILQLKRTTAMPTAHIITSNTTEVSVPLIASITPKSASSVIRVEFFSTMATGSASALLTILYRRINGGAYTAMTPFTNTASRYQYGWSYDTSGWGPRMNVYYDSPNTTGLVEYVVNYRLFSGTSTAYLVHQYQEYGYTLTEIAQ
jgi:hypothetical protein